jgi:uncharacterized peroxidase-related enzyme
MSRIEVLDDAHIPAASRPALDAVANQLGFVPHMHQALAASPRSLNAVLGFKKAMGTTLDAATRQGIAHAVTEVNRCGYCDDMHTWVSKRLTGLDDDEIALNRCGLSVHARRSAALAFAREVALTRGNVSDEALATVRAAGFSDAHVLDIVALVVMSSLTNYFNNVMKTDADVFPTQAAPPAGGTM